MSHLDFAISDVERDISCGNGCIAVIRSAIQLSHEPFNLRTHIDGFQSLLEICSQIWEGRLRCSMEARLIGVRIVYVSKIKI